MVGLKGLRLFCQSAGEPSPLKLNLGFAGRQVLVSTAYFLRAAPAVLRSRKKGYNGVLGLILTSETYSGLPV